MQWTLVRNVIMGVIFLVIVSAFLYSIAKKSEAKTTLYNLPPGVNISIRQNFLIFAPLDVIWFGDSLNGACNFSDFISTLPPSDYALPIGFQDISLGTRFTQKFFPTFFIPLVTKDWGSLLPSSPAECDGILCYYDISEEGGFFEIMVSIDRELLENYIKSKNPSFELLDYNFSLTISFSKEGEYLGDFPYYEFSRDNTYCSTSGNIQECNYKVNILRRDMNFPTEMELHLKFNITYQDILGNTFFEIREMKPSPKFLIVYYIYNPENFSKISFENLKERYKSRMNSLLVYPCVIRRGSDFTGLIYLEMEGNFVNLSKCSTKKFSQASYNGEWFCKKEDNGYFLYSPFAICRLGEDGMPKEEPSVVFLDNFYSEDNRLEFRRAIYRELSLLKEENDVKETFCSAICYSMKPYFEPCFSLCYDSFSTTCNLFCPAFCLSYNILDFSNQSSCTYKCKDACNYINEINTC